MRIDAIILSNINGQWYQMKRIKLSDANKEFTWKDKKFLVDTSRCLFMAKKRFGYKGILMYDFALSNPLEPSNINLKRIEGLTSDDHDFLFGQKTIQQLVRGSLGKVLRMEVIIYIALGLAVGIIVGIIVQPIIIPPVTMIINPPVVAPP